MKIKSRLVTCLYVRQGDQLLLRHLKQKQKVKLAEIFRAGLGVYCQKFNINPDNFYNGTNTDGWKNNLPVVEITRNPAEQN